MNISSDRKLVVTLTLDAVDVNEILDELYRISVQTNGDLVGCGIYPYLDRITKELA